MRYIKSYLVYEDIKNPKNVIYFIRKFLIEIKNIQGLNKDDYKFSKENPLYYELILTSKDDKIIDKIIKKYESKFLREGIVMSHYKGTQSHLSDDLEILDTYDFKYHIYFKELYTSLIKPNRFVYHFSDKSRRESIQKNGILPTPHEGGNWKFDSKLKYPDAVFAVNSETDKWSSGDRWKIDTTKIKNKWWQDLNFRNRKDLIMTFDAIPPDAISLDETT